MTEHKKQVSTDFIVKTNQEYAAWCATFYIPEALDKRGMISLDGLLAWQEQQKKIDALEAKLSQAQSRIEYLESEIENKEQS